MEDMGIRRDVNFLENRLDSLIIIKGDFKMYNYRSIMLFLLLGKF